MLLKDVQARVQAGLKEGVLGGSKGPISLADLQVKIIKAMNIVSRTDKGSQ